MLCPVRGHNHHALEQLSDHTQDGTGAKALTVTCRRNGRRWFLTQLTWTTYRLPGKFNRVR